MDQRIIRNRAKCLRCGDIIESTNRWDFVTCSCGSLSVDGGRDYLKRCGNPENCEELSEYAPLPPPRVGYYGFLLDQKDEPKILGGKLSE